MFDALFAGALQSLVRDGIPYFTAVPNALNMAMHAVEYLRAQGVNVDSRVPIEGGVAYAQPGASYAPQMPPQPTAYGPHVYQGVPQQAPQQMMAQPAAAPRQAPVVPQSSSVVTPTIDVVNQPATPDLRDFISSRLNPAKWVAEDNLSEAQQFIQDLQNTFGITPKQ